MYDQSAIDALVSRIGWAQPTPLPGNTTPVIVLDSDNTDTDSGRTFRNFHSLVIAENVVMTMPIPNITLTQNPDNTVLNAFLLDLKTEGARKVLHRLFVVNMQARTQSGSLIDLNGTDWTSTITDKIAVFDECYGYQVAYDTLTMMIASTRTNSTEGAIGQKGYLTAQANGIVDPKSGNVIKPGIYQELERAYANLSGLLFPAFTKRPRATFFPM